MVPETQLYDNLYLPQPADTEAAISGTVDGTTVIDSLLISADEMFEYFNNSETNSTRNGDPGVVTVRSPLEESVQAPNDIVVEQPPVTSHC